MLSSRNPDVTGCRPQLTVSSAVSGRLALVTTHVFRTCQYDTRKVTGVASCKSKVLSDGLPCPLLSILGSHRGCGVILGTISSSLGEKNLQFLLIFLPSNSTARLGRHGHRACLISKHGLWTIIQLNPWMSDSNKSLCLTNLEFILYYKTAYFLISSVIRKHNSFFLIQGTYTFL